MKGQIILPPNGDQQQTPGGIWLPKSPQIVTPPSPRIPQEFQAFAGKVPIIGDPKTKH